MDGGEVHQSGNTVQLLEGSHKVHFIAGGSWLPDMDQNTFVSRSLTTKVVGTYAFLGGAVSVNIQPEAAVVDGAQWRIDGGGWQTNGAVVPYVEPGMHVITFKPVDGWKAPDLFFISVGGDLTVTGTYVGFSITVNIEPEPAVLLGARWRLDQGLWQTNGATLQVAARPSSPHGIGFEPLQNWQTPPGEFCFPSSYPGDGATCTGKYTATFFAGFWIRVNIEPAPAVSDKARWRFEWPLSGASQWYTNGAIANMMVGSFYSVAFSQVTNWYTPDPILVPAFPLGSMTTLTGKYTEPGEMFKLLNVSEGWGGWIDVQFRWDWETTPVTVWGSSDLKNWFPCIVNSWSSSPSLRTIGITELPGSTARFYRAHY